MEEIKNAKLNNLIKVYDYIKEYDKDGNIINSYIAEAGWVNTNLIDKIDYSYRKKIIDDIEYVYVFLVQGTCFSSTNWRANHDYYLKKSDLE